MERNSATRSLLRVSMAEGAGPLDTDPLADVVVDLVLEAMDVEPARLGGDRTGAGPSDRFGSTRVLAQRRAAPALDRVTALAGVARAAARYRQAVSRGKGKKKARRMLFESLDAWEEARRTAAP